ncbi:winged helix-turn-helix transcriptional regulator [Mucilaginibacter sp. UR6-1]|uniref:winged helix-turn-helix transcriptional regulator n=1 Tax=Mucilaginibacter sp. UR6-1 TaxID=1435643 RepID=UPI001E602A22|nr:winged helix-turn-helix transcriptional regulator [Mucilaginibacter sp. UR6-1]MCC8407759.1 winged helix-turn-helix transcriptional regulator [Mucilaginibacter sp. UR6-1]
MENGTDHHLTAERQPAVPAAVEGKRYFPRILSKELSELKANKLVSRKVRDTRPVTVEYAATAYCESLREVIVVISNWGLLHREVIAGRLRAGDSEQAL